MKVNLMYLAGPRYGGWVTYTAHLFHALRLAGHDVALYQLAARVEGRSREYLQGVPYQNIPLAAAEVLASKGATILTAVDKDGVPAATSLLQRGALLVLHDPTELHPGMVAALQHVRRPPVIIREVNRKAVAAALGTGLDPRFIPHPYVRSSNLLPLERCRRPMPAVAYSRLDWDKNTLLIAQANALLHPDQRIRIFGAENRLYTHHKLDPAVPGWRDSYFGPFPRDLDAGAIIAQRARWAVDLSVIKGDGGGSQYTFLEAWDAGTALVVHRGWLRAERGAVRDGETAHAVESAEELADVVTCPPPKVLVDGGLAELEHHGPVAIGAEYVRALS